MDDQAKAAARQFGREVKTARKELGLTQVRLAKECLTSYHTIEMVENRGVTPLSGVFFSLCELLGLNPEDFHFGGQFEKIIADWRKQTQGRN